MPQTLWTPSLVLALYQNRQVPASRYVQMATIGVDGRPANRTLVFRGFLNETSGLIFTTDLRSLKATELARSSWAEVCWFFPATHEQFRIGGAVAVVGAEATDDALVAARHATWHALPHATRVTFTWPAPGEPREPRVPYPTDHPDPEKPLSHFGLLVLDPQKVDLLEINGHPQNRWEFARDDRGRWSGIEVNP
jgi:pyridoxamine 5'-phosphate oxidase